MTTTEVALIDFLISCNEMERDIRINAEEIVAKSIASVDRELLEKIHINTSENYYINGKEIYFERKG